MEEVILAGGDDARAQESVTALQFVQRATQRLNRQVPFDPKHADDIERRHIVAETHGVLEPGELAAVTANRRHWRSLDATIQSTGAAIATSAHASGNTSTRVPVSTHRCDSSIDR